MFEKNIVRLTAAGGLFLLLLVFTHTLSGVGVVIGAAIYSAAVLSAEWYLVSKIRKNKQKEKT